MVPITDRQAYGIHMKFMHSVIDSGRAGYNNATAADKFYGR